MRRGSFVGPLLLIVIGALFLARNIYPDLPLLDYLARYWPFVLIAWGLLRVVEIIAWSANGRPLPTRGVGGGEWVLVIFLCLVGASVHAARGFADWLPSSRFRIGGLEVFGDSYDYPFSTEQPAAKNTRVVIAGFRGNARITGADVDKVTVTGHTTVRSLDKEGADRAAESAKVQVEGQGSQITIRANQPGNGNGPRVSADMEIVVPKGATIEAHGRSGDFDISGVDGDVSIDSNSSAVRLENLGGSVQLDVRGGDMIRASNVKGSFFLKGRGNDIDLQKIQGPVTINGSYSGIAQLQDLSQTVHYIGTYTEFSMNKIPGYVRHSIGDIDASNIVGPVRITSTRSKDIRLSGFTESLEIQLRRGDVDLRPGPGPLPKINVRTNQGDVELAIPEGAKFDLTASSERGELSNDYGSPIQSDFQRRGGTLRGNNGGPSVAIDTNQGDVRIRKAGGADLIPPAPPRPPAVPQPPVSPKTPEPSPVVNQ